MKCGQRKLFGIGALVAGVLAAGGTSAHEWYSLACCSNHDCAAIPASAVTITKEGFRVRLDEGDHPMVSGPFDATVSHGSELQSKDQDYHICIVPWDEGVARCLYAPVMGS